MSKQFISSIQKRSTETWRNISFQIYQNQPWLEQLDETNRPWNWAFELVGKVMPRNQWYILMDQHHLVLKDYHRDHIWPQTESVSETKHFYCFHCMKYSHFMLHFTTFHNVSIYVISPKTSNVVYGLQQQRTICE